MNLAHFARIAFLACLRLIKTSTVSAQILSLPALIRLTCGQVGETLGKHDSYLDSTCKAGLQICPIGQIYKSK